MVLMKYRMMSIAIGERNFIEKDQRGRSLNRGLPERTSCAAFLTPQTYPKKRQTKRAPIGRNRERKMKSILPMKSIFVKKAMPPEDRADGIPKQKMNRPTRIAAFFRDQLLSSTK